MTSAKADFVHLHVHTTYSLLDSTLYYTAFNVHEHCNLIY